MKKKRQFLIEMVKVIPVIKDGGKQTARLYDSAGFLKPCSKKADRVVLQRAA